MSSKAAQEWHEKTDAVFTAALRADAVTLLNALDRMSRREHLSINVKHACEQLRNRLGVVERVDPDDEWQGP